MAPDNLPTYLQLSDNNTLYKWGNTSQWEPKPISSTSTPTKQSNPASESVDTEDEALFIADKLDKLDGFEITTKNGKNKNIGDGKIAKKYWNNFADSAGIPKLRDNELFITIEDATKKLQELKDTNPNLFYYLPKKMGIADISAHNDSIENTVYARPRGKGSTFIDKSKNFISTTFQKTAWGLIKMHVGGEGAKLMDNPDDYVATNEDAVKNVRKAIKKMASKASVYPLSKRLLELSVTPESTYLRHKYYNKENKKLIYSVLDDTQTRKIFKERQIRKVNKNPIKTILFESDTEESNIVSNDPKVKEVAGLWLKDKDPKRYFAGGLNNSRDTAWAINKCYFTGMKYTDNGDSITVTGYIEDIYNFEEKKYNDTVTEKLNHLAVKAQEIGAIEPYRVVIPFSVTIPKNELNI